ncbi:MAG: ankyrin repeat domain-containing protein [Synergistaceae bacterium]|nr:ankyrin repeat domain-containing protein [Synergistaceae bacterium]MBR0094020.1 ankyrin repeat domain-containing protein [Synergistaceae bacterium]
MKNPNKFTPKQFAELCKFGSFSDVKHAIEEGASLKRKVKYLGVMLTPLGIAVASENYDAIRALLAYGANPADGYIAAIGSEDEGMLKFLASTGADVNCKDAKGRTPLLCAVAIQNLDIVKLLIEQGADVNCTSDLGFNALMYILFMHDLNGMTFDLKGIVRELMWAGCDYRRAMLEAIASGNLDFLKVLAEWGADFNAECALGKTPLAIALYKLPSGGSLDLIDGLVSLGAKVNVIVDLGEGHTTTNLDIAISLNNPEAVRRLLKFGADPNLVDDGGRNALMYAVLSGGEVTRIILEAGVDPNLADKEGRTALTTAVIEEGTDEDVLEALFEYGADVDARDNKGRTALIWAIMSKANAPALLVEGMIRTGGFMAECGKSCLAVAVLSKFLGREAQIRNIKLLIRNGADLSIKDNAGMNAFMCAAIQEDDEIKKMLRAVRKEELGMKINS